MRNFAMVFVPVLAALSGHAPPATWYVDAGAPQPGDGKSWETAFSQIQEGVEAASDADTVLVAEGVYFGATFKGKNIRLLSTNPCDPGVVARTIVDSRGSGVVISFDGTEDETCVLSGFTIRNGENGGSHLYPGAGIQGRGTEATIENNIIAYNSHSGWGGAVGECHGLIQNNIICYNVAGRSEPFGLRGEGGGLYWCDGTVRNNTIVHNWVTGTQEYVPDEGFVWVDGVGGALFGCAGTVENCIIWGNSEPQVYGSREPVYSLVGLNPEFVDETNSDFRLRRTSPCIDAGFNDPELPETDIVGMHRIMFGGKSFTVDIGAYEFFYSGVQTGPGPDETTLIWSFVRNKTYSIFYTDDLLNWHTAIANFPSSGSQTTSWLDDGSLTGLPPLLAPKRFYRVLENPQ